LRYRSGASKLDVAVLVTPQEYFRIQALSWRMTLLQGYAAFSNLVDGTVFTRVVPLLSATLPRMILLDDAFLAGKLCS